MKRIQTYSTLNICLIFFVALLAIVFPSSKSQNNSIKCDSVSKTIDAEKSIDYNALKTCFKSIPFNAKNVDEIIDSVTHILSSYYVFLDQANENPPSGFTYQPINLTSKLNSLRKTKFKSDFDFKVALRNLIFKVKDGHARFESTCYQNFFYNQGLSLSSVITADKKRQIIKVFDDELDPSNNDCEVTEIEGKPALQAIKEFANNSIAQSKDLGVRFNMALAPSTGRFGQQFTSRFDMPETSDITYKLSCPKKKSFLLKRKWNITFNGGADFFKNVCLNLNSESTTLNDNVTSGNKDKVPTSNDKVTKLTPRDKFQVSKLNENKQKIAHAKLIYSSDADFYLLDDDESIGVAAIHTVNDDIESDLQNGFEEFKKRKVKKIVLDFSNNDGGSVTVPLFINSILFSSKQPNSYPTRININNFTIPIIKSNFKTSGNNFSSLYNPNFYLSFPKGGRFNSPDQFILGSRKNRTSNLYLNALTSDELNLIKDTPHFPWTSDDFIILTNGYCASACALITLFFSEFHKVETIAVGGLLDKNLSFSTFPGGEFTSSNVIMGNAGDGAADVDFPNTLFLPIRKSCSFFKNGTEKEVLEYSYRPANHRFYYNETNAKDPSILWVEAAKILNKEKS